MAELLTIDPESPQPDRIARAAERIRKGAVIAIPTDTIYGLAADPMNRRGVESIFAVKGRSPDAAVPLLVNSLDMAMRCAAQTPPLFDELAGKFWPGPVTIVVRAAPDIPDLLTGGTGFVGLRFPKAAIVNALMDDLGGPITATSANRSGQPHSTTAEQVSDALGQSIPLIVDGGPSPSEKASTVVRLRGDQWEMLREGSVREADFKEFERYRRKA